MDFYDRVEQLLKQKHITAKKMCEDLNIPYGTFMTQRKRRSFRISVNSVLKIAKYLNTTSDYLVNGVITNEKPDNTIPEGIHIKGVVARPLPGNKQPTFTKDQIKALEELLKTLKESDEN